MRIVTSWVASILFIALLAGCVGPSTTPEGQDMPDEDAPGGSDGDGTDRGGDGTASATPSSPTPPPTATPPGPGTAMPDPRDPVDHQAEGNSVDHGDHRRHALGLPTPPGPQGHDGGEDGATCGPGDLVEATPEEVVAYVRSHDYDCLRFLFSWTAELATILSEANVVAIFEETEALSPEFTGNNSQNMEELWQFVHAAYFQSAYHEAEMDLGQAAQAAGINASDAFTANPHHNAANDEAPHILWEWITTVDAMWQGHQYIGVLEAILITFLDEPGRADAAGFHDNVAYQVMFLAQRGTTDGAFQAALTASFVDALGDFGVNTTLDGGLLYLPNNALYTLGRVMCNVPAHKPLALDHVTDALGIHPYLSQPHLWAVAAVDDCNDCVTADGDSICREDLYPDIDALLFPDTLPYHGQTFVVRVNTSEVPAETVTMLWRAASEVAAQFQRVTLTITPVAGDPNGVLQVYLYPNKTSYEHFHTFRFGLGSANGGIYIEQDGTFYTYDRTAAESIYTLEELMRHEYAHYLIGRHLVPGMWGEAPIYDGGRMVWFDEGFAEFITWSTPRDGVKARANLVRQVETDGANRLSIGDIFDASYSSFTFYRYAGLWFHFLYTHHVDELLAITAIAHDGDTAAFDAWEASMRDNASMEAAYQDHLDALVAQLDDLDDPQTSVPDWDALASDHVAAIQASFRETRLGYLADCFLEDGGDHALFSCRGTLSGTLHETPDTKRDWHAVDDGLDEILAEAASLAPDNLQWMTCRAGAMRDQTVEGGTYTLTDYACTGPLRPSEDHIMPPALLRIQDDLNRTRLGVGAQCVAGDTNITCNKDLSTALHANGTTNETLQAAIDAGVAELWNQVYAASPPFYRDLMCAPEGPVQRVQTDAGVYGVAPVVCVRPTA